MKASAIARGTAAERPTSYIAGKDAKGDPLVVQVLLRPLSALEEADIEAEAIAFAKKRGAPTTENSAIYEAAFMGATLALAVLDPDSPPAAREKYFDQGLDQVLALDPDTIAQLHEQQRIWQEECSPSANKMSAVELMRLCTEIAERNDPKAYSLLSPGMRWRLQRITGVQLAMLLGPKPPSSSASAIDSWKP